MIVSGLLGLVAFSGMFLVARKATSHTPTRMQNFIEMVFTMVNDQVKDTFHAKSNLVTPLAITIFVWVFLMNAMDLIPVDFLPNILLLFGVEYFKQVPTTDPNLTFAMSISVFFIMIAMNLKHKGILGFGKEVLTQPFGKYLFPVNFLFRVIEDIAKPISLALRLLETCMLEKWYLF